MYFVAAVSASTEVAQKHNNERKSIHLELELNRQADQRGWKQKLMTLIVMVGRSFGWPRSQSVWIWEMGIVGNLNNAQGDK